MKKKKIMRVIEQDEKKMRRINRMIRCVRSDRTEIKMGK